MRNSTWLGLLLVASLAPAPSHALPGQIDSTFTGFGITSHPARGLAKVAVQPDGKIVAASQVQVASNDDELIVLRRGPNGGVDPTWGTNGVVQVDVFDKTEGPLGIGIAPNGEVVVVVKGSFSTSAVALVRFSSDGTLVGINAVTIEVPHGLASGQHVAVAPDGSAFVGGTVDQDLAIVKHRRSGSVDRSFGVDGIAIVDAGGIDDGIAIALQFDGKILLAGQSSGNVTIARFTADGVPDPTFGTNGVLTFGAGSPNADGVSSIALHADGDIVVAGADMGLTDRGAFLARVSPAGALDLSFGGTGIVLSPVSVPPQWSRGHAVVAQADGKTILVGQFPTNSFTERYDASGVLDPVWGTGGSKTYVRVGFQYPGSAVLLPGRLLLGGYNDPLISETRTELMAIEVGEFCGDGIVQAGETCDDGVFLPGGCCSETCTHRPASTPCFDDVNSCTSDTCDGAGTCEHVVLPDGTSCTDDLTCTTGESCTQGVCGDGVADACSNPIVCYKARTTKGTPGFEKVSGVSLSDPIESGSFGVKNQFQLCLAADVDAQTAPDPSTHHVAYKIKTSPGEPKHVKQTSIVVTDALGTHSFDTKKPELLLVPADMRLGGVGTVPDPSTTMNYKCYKVKQTPGIPRFLHGQVTASEQFESRLYDVFSPRRLCYAVDKDGEGTLESDAMLTCYRARRGPGEPNHDRVENLIRTIDGFGTLALDTKKTQEICIPATLGP